MHEAFELAQVGAALLVVGVGVGQVGLALKLQGGLQFGAQDIGGLEGGVHGMGLRG